MSLSLRTYYHIALLLELQDGEGGAPYPMQSAFIVSYLRSGANIDTVMGIAIGYLCITCEGNSGEPSLSPENEARRRPVIVELQRPIPSCIRYRLPTPRDPKHLQVGEPPSSLYLFGLALYESLGFPPALLRPAFAWHYSAASCPSCAVIL